MFFRPTPHFRLLLGLFIFGLSAGGGAKAESYYALRLPPPLALQEGWWRGFVLKGAWPTEFFLEVKGSALESARVTLRSEVSTWELGGLWQEGRSVTIPGRLQGEYLAGELKDGAFVGRYHPGVVEGEAKSGVPGRSFFFLANLSRESEVPQPGAVWNLSGVWRVRIQDQPEVEALFSHTDGGRLRGLLREGVPGPRYFDGRVSGHRFALEGFGGAVVLEGRYEAGGVLRGELVSPGGRVPFFAQRKGGAAVANLGGRHP